MVKISSFGLGRTIFLKLVHNGKDACPKSNGFFLDPNLGNFLFCSPLSASKVKPLAFSFCTDTHFQ